MPCHAAHQERRSGDLLVRVGAVVFAVGVLGALLLPAGFGIALLGLLLGARSHE